MMQSDIVVKDPVGLHARPASLFVKLANSFSAEIKVRNMTANTPWVNAKSILSLLTCGVKQGDEIGIKAEGVDEEVAVDALVELVRSNFANELN